METLVVHAFRRGERTHELSSQSPVIAVANARMLFKKGWEVHITDAQGQRFQPEKFDKLLEFDRKSAIKF